MFLEKEVRVHLRGEARESFTELKKRDDKEAKAIVKSVERIIKR